MMKLLQKATEIPESNAGGVATLQQHGLTGLMQMSQNPTDDFYCLTDKQNMTLCCY